jgi:predicted transcriptional regulator
MTTASPTPELGGYVSDIVSAYVANHLVEASALPALIQSVRRALEALRAGVPETPSDARPEPAVPIKKSVFPNYIVCLEDGVKLKMLKRHLKTAYNMEPDEYRAKWGLPGNYPMTAPNYAEMRSSLAKQNKLGQKAVPQVVIPAPPEPIVQKIPAERRSQRRQKQPDVE